uniref:WD repeat domain 17 n=1 Tax=Molossus molossus TaxID=27622 RepID=A0A7J8GN96_MOLMO|nr:WD repeat domain 17 [Molossus molossus]
MAWMTYIANWFEQDDWYEGLQRANMSRVRQVGLLAAGCQPWNKDVCAASGERFAYCATLAVYVYQARPPRSAGAGTRVALWRLLPGEAPCSSGPFRDRTAA